MRILFTTHHELEADSGAAGTTSALACACRERGHQASIFSHSDLPSWFSWHLKALTFPAFVAAHVQRSILHEQIDVVDASTGDIWLWATISRSLRAHKLPALITRSHGLEHLWHEQNLVDSRLRRTRLRRRYYLYHGGYRLWEVAESMRSADLALVVNTTDLNFAVSRLNVDPASAAVVPNGLPPRLLGLPAPARHEPHEPLRIAQVGRFSPLKGIEYGCEALNLVLRRDPRVRVSFLGTDRPRDAVTAYFAREVHDRILVVPRFAHDELTDLLCESQIILSPTLTEGFGKGLLEGMACGLAPVATDTPGPREFIQNGKSGVLVPPRDSSALAAALVGLVEDPERLHGLRVAAHARAQAYSWGSVAEHTLALYEASLHSRAANGRGITSRSR